MATISSLVGSEWVRRNSEQFVSTFTFRHHSSPGLCWNNLISIALSGPSFAEREGCRRKSPCGGSMRFAVSNHQHCNHQGRACKTNHLIQMSVQECPKIEVRVPIGCKNYCAMPCNDQDSNLYQICQKLSLCFNKICCEAVVWFMMIHHYHVLSSDCLSQLFLSFYSVSNFHLRQWHPALLCDWRGVATIWGGEPCNALYFHAESCKC